MTWDKVMCDRMYLLFKTCFNCHLLSEALPTPDFSRISADLHIILQKHWVHSSFVVHKICIIIF